MVSFSSTAKNNISSLRDHLRDSNLTSSIVNKQEPWDGIITPALRAFEKIHIGQSLTKEDIMALGQLAELPTNTLIPHLQIDRKLATALMDLANSSNSTALDEFNEILGLENLNKRASHRGANLEVTKRPHVGSSKSLY